MPRLSLAAGGTTTSTRISGRTPGLARRRRTFSKLTGEPAFPPDDHLPTLSPRRPPVRSPCQALIRCFDQAPSALCPRPPQRAGQPLGGDRQAASGALRQRDQEPLELQARPAVNCCTEHRHLLQSRLLKACVFDPTSARPRSLRKRAGNWHDEDVADSKRNRDDDGGRKRKDALKDSTNRNQKPATKKQSEWLATRDPRPATRDPPCVYSV